MNRALNLLSKILPWAGEKSMGEESNDFLPVGAFFFFFFLRSAVFAFTCPKRVPDCPVESGRRSAPQNEASRLWGLCVLAKSMHRGLPCWCSRRPSLSVRGVGCCRFFFGMLRCFCFRHRHKGRTLVGWGAVRRICATCHVSVFFFVRAFFFWALQVFCWSNDLFDWISILVVPSPRHPLFFSFFFFPLLPAMSPLRPTVFYLVIWYARHGSRLRRSPLAFFELALGGV